MRSRACLFIFIFIALPCWGLDLRFVRDGDNPCARVLGASRLLEPPSYYQPGPLSEDQIERELQKRFPPFAWGSWRPQWIIDGHHETLQDLDSILTEAIDGTAHHALNLPVTSRLRVGRYLPILAPRRIRRADSLRQKLRRYDASTVTDEQMLELLTEFFWVTADPSHKYELLSKWLRDIRAEFAGQVPRFHFFFTLRPMDYLDVVGLRAAGIFPITMPTTQEAAYDGYEPRDSWHFTAHDFSHAVIQLKAIRDELRAARDKTRALHTEYVLMRDITKTVLSRPEPLLRLAGIGGVFKLYHETGYTAFNGNSASMSALLASSESLFVSDLRTRKTRVENLRFPDEVWTTNHWLKTIPFLRPEAF